jgi:hypothetical protein
VGLGRVELPAHFVCPFSGWSHFTGLRESIRAKILSALHGRVAGGCTGGATYRGDTAMGSEAGLEDVLVPSPCSGINATFGGTNNGGYYQIAQTLVFYPSGTHAGFARHRLINN